MKKKTWTIFILLAVSLLYANLFVCAADDVPVIYGSNLSDGNLHIVAGNLENVQEVSCQIGNVTCEDATISESLGIDTYILVDNSLSIDSKYHETIRQILNTLVGTVNDQEKVTIATFDREVHYLIQESTNVEELMKTVEDITYENQYTKVTDVMYSLCKDLEKQPFDGLRRIVLISDGAESAGIGYTRDEMVTELKRLSYPVYTVGCTYGDNTKELEDMFSLSRMTRADSVWLDEKNDVQEIVGIINQCRNSVQVDIPIPDMLGDGTEKGVKLDFQTNEGVKSISTTAVMPFIASGNQTAIEQLTEEDATEEDATEEDVTEKSVGISAIAESTEKETDISSIGGLTEETAEPLLPEGLTEKTAETLSSESLEEETAETLLTESLTEETTAVSHTGADEIAASHMEGMQEESLAEKDTEEREQIGTEKESDSLSEETETTPSLNKILLALVVVLAGFLVLRMRKKGKGKKERKERKTDVPDQAKRTDVITDYDDETQFDRETEYDSEETEFSEKKTDMTDRTEMVDDGATEMLDAQTDAIVYMQSQQEEPDFVNIRFTDMCDPTRINEVPLYTTVSVGRSANMNQIAFDYERSVSSVHCEIIRRGRKVYVRDLDSTNGTWIDDIRVEEGEREIYSGAVLKMGRLEVIFEIV